MPLKKLIRLFFFALLMVALKLPGQNPYIRHFTTFDGLPSNIVNSVFQDSRKFIWFATDAGAVRFDGSKFTTFTKKDGLNTSKIIRIKEDSLGRVWIFNMDGSMNFYYMNKIYNAANAPFLNTLKPDEPFLDFFQDDTKTLYFYNVLYDIYALDSNNHIKKYEKLEELFCDQLRYVNGARVIGPHPTWTTSLSDFYTCTLYIIRKKAKGEYLLWAKYGMLRLKELFKDPVLLQSYIDYKHTSCSRNGFFYIIGGLKDSYILKYKDETLVNRVKLPIKVNYDLVAPGALLYDKDGYFWVGTFDDQLYCLQEEESSEPQAKKELRTAKNFIRTTTSKIIQQLDIRHVNGIIQDQEDNIWVSSSTQGVYKISPGLNSQQHYGNNLFQNNGIQELAAGLWDGLWLSNGRTIYLLKNKDLYTLNFQKENTSFNVIYHMRSNKLIVGENNSYFYGLHDLKPDPLTKKVNFRRVDISGNAPSGLTINQGENKLIFNGYFDFDLIDPVEPDTLFNNYRLWNKIGQKSYNVGSRIYYTYFNNKDELIINAKKDYILKNDTCPYYSTLAFLDNKIIRQHLNLNDSTELFNIEDEGIFLFHNKKFFDLTSKSWNESDLKISCVTYDKRVLYLASSGNIYTCRNPFEIFEKNPVDIRLIDVDFRNIHKILAYNNSLYIASDDGLTVIPDTMIYKIRIQTPLPYFTSVQVNDKDTDLSDLSVTLTGNNKIKFGFAAINYSSAPTFFSYKLQGFDKNWTMGSTREIVYSNLPRGNYVFTVRANKPGAPLSNALEYRIRIKSHFWQHPLFFMFLSLLFTGLIALIIIRRKNIQINRRELENQLITLEQKALQSMMNPHFIFNSLSSIQTYLLEKKSNEAGLYLSQFARLIRQNLNAINAASINLEEEIDRLRNYLDLENLRRDIKFDYTIDVDENVEEADAQIPSMIIQPFVENAILHGIATLEEKGRLNIKFQSQDEKSMKVIIEDNGIGMKRSEAYSSKQEKHLHLGMEMTRKRLELLGKKFSVKTAIEFFETNPGAANPGTKVVLVVPVGM